MKSTLCLLTVALDYYRALCGWCASSSVPCFGQVVAFFQRNEEGDEIFWRLSSPIFGKGATVRYWQYLVNTPGGGDKWQQKERLFEDKIR